MYRAVMVREEVVGVQGEAAQRTGRPGQSSHAGTSVQHPTPTPAPTRPPTPVVAILHQFGGCRGLLGIRWRLKLLFKGSDSRGMVLAKSRR